MPELGKTLEGVIGRHIERVLNDVATMIPARVSKVRTVGGTIVSVDCFPLIKARKPKEDGTYDVETIAEIYNIPVVQPGAGGARLTFPVSVNDTVLLGFSQASLDRWKNQGGMTDPEDYRHHDLSDAVAILGLRDFAHALVTVPSNKTTWGYDTPTGARIEIGPAEIKLGPLAVDTTYKFETHNLAFQTLIAAIGSAIGMVPSGGAGASAVTTALNTYNLALASYHTVMTKVQ